jgi:hypothetical protein
VRIQFYLVEQAYDDQGVMQLNRTWINSKRCKDFYIDKMDVNSIYLEPSVASEFNDSGWICPDIDSFQVNNDPWNYKEGPGNALVMTVNTCTVAQNISLEN